MSQMADQSCQVSHHRQEDCETTWRAVKNSTSGLILQYGRFLRETMARTYSTHYG